jgi:hypothetical protein
VHHRQLRLAAPADHGHDAVADVEALRVGTALHHLAGQLQAGDVRGRAGRRRVPAGQLHHVRAVDTRAAHPHQQLAASGLRVGALLDHELPVLDGYRPHPRGI